MEKTLGTLSTPRALLGAACLAAALAVAGLHAPPASAQQTEPPPERVNINTADRATLATALTGIGVSRAEAIVRYRELYGPFETVEELVEVSGVGASTLERNRDRITLE